MKLFFFILFIITISYAVDLTPCDTKCMLDWFENGQNLTHWVIGGEIYTVDVEVIITDDTYKYCPGNGIDYRGGCALLNESKAIVPRYSTLNSYKTMIAVDHEILHIWMWKNQHDASHGERFVERMNKSIW